MTSTTSIGDVYNVINTIIILYKKKYKVEGRASRASNKMKVGSGAMGE
jgi:hypothetical protein